MKYGFNIKIKMIDEKLIKTKINFKTKLTLVPVTAALIELFDVKVDV